MVNAVSPGTGVNSATSGAAPSRPVDLDAELTRSKGQLADWVACASANTPEGQDKIEALAAKIGTLKQHLRRAEQSAEAARTPARAQPVFTALGGHLDVYA